MPRARRGRRRKDNNSPVTREEFNALWDAVNLIEQRSLVGRGIAPVEGGGAGGDDGYVITWPGAANIPVRPSDGVAPGSSPTPEVEGGYGFFSVKWASVDNPDTVTYQVHVSASSGFDPGPSTLAGSHAGTLAFIKNLPNGDPFLAATTYYFKLVAMDVDGEAAAGGEDSAQLVAVPSSSVGTDGGTPDKPAVTLRSGPGWIQASWPSVGGTVDPVGYWVYMSDSSGFTPGAGNFIAQTEGNTIVLNKLTAGTQLQTGTTYYVKVIAASLLSGNISATSDEDSGTPAVIDHTVTTISNLDAGTIVTGSLDAARIATGSLNADRITANTITSDEIAANAITSDELAANAVTAAKILAGEITADHFQSVLALVTSLLAGEFGGANVQIGYGTKDDGAGGTIVDTGFVGIRAYDGTNTDPYFKLPADGGPASFRGTVQFGVLGSSKLLPNDMIQIREQTSDTFGDPILVQSGAIADDHDDDLLVVWDTEPIAGNCLILVGHCYESTTAPTYNTPTGWTQIETNQWGGSSQCRSVIYIREADGTADDTPVLDVDPEPDAFLIQYFEYSGVDASELAASSFEEDNALANNDPVDTGTSGSVTQKALVFASGCLMGQFTNSHGVVTWAALKTGTKDAAFTQIADNLSDDASFGFSGGYGVRGYCFQRVTDTGTQQWDGTVNGDTDAWNGMIVVLPATTATIDPAEAETVRLYAADVDGDSFLHTIDEDGNKRILATGPFGDKWDMEILSGTGDVASTAAHSTVNTTITVTGVKTGDICLFLNKENQNRSFIWRCPVFATADDSITLQGFNADTGTQDPPSDTFYFLVIHR